MAADRIRSGSAHIIIAGGAESMSMMPMAGTRFAPNPWLVDHLPEIYMGMGLTAEKVSENTASSARIRTRSPSAATRTRCAPRRKATSTTKWCR